MCRTFILSYSLLSTSAGFCRAAFHTRQIMLRKMTSPIPMNMTAYPNGKAKNDENTSKSKYSLKNRFKMTQLYTLMYQT